MSEFNEPWKVHEQGEPNEFCMLTRDDGKWIISFRQNGEMLPFSQREIARRVVACVNACAGSSTEWLEFSVSEDCADLSGPFEPLATRITSILKAGLAYMVERDQLRKQRDELLAALEGLTGDIQSLIGESCGVAGLHMNGDIAPWSELEAGGRFERLTHLPAAHAAIASVKGNCVQQSAKNETQAGLTLTDETQTGIPAIVFYPAGSLGEEVHP